MRESVLSDLFAAPPELLRPEFVVFGKEKQSLATE